MHLRIAVIGDMQMGKSFFIKALHQYAKIPAPESLKIGNCNVGETKEITTYTINGIVPKEFPLGADVKEIHQTELYDKLCDGLIPFSTSCEVGTDWTLNLEVIDTPGLDTNNDDKILEDIAQELKKGPLHALIMVFKTGQYPFTGSGKQRIRRILEKFPEYHSNLIILHNIENRSEFTRRFVDFSDNKMKEFCQGVDLTNRMYYVGTNFNQRYAKEENLCVSYREMKAFLTGIQSLTPTSVKIPEPIPKITRRIVLIGELQSGKSFFIKKLYSYAKEVPPNTLIIGNGNLATTKQITTYHISDFKYQEYESTPDNMGYSKISENLQVKGNHSCDLEIIDTPGLSGIPENNTERLDDILNYIKKEPIHAIVYMISQYNVVMSRFHKKLYAKVLAPYSKCSNNIMIINAVRDYNQSSDEAIKERIQLLTEAFTESMPVNLNNKFFHIDSSSIEFNASKREPLTQYGVNNFLTTLSKMNSVALG